MWPESKRIISYIGSRTGRDIDLAELYKLVEVKSNPNAKNAGKARRKEQKNKEQEKKRELDDLLLVMQNEKLLEIKRKKITVARDFTLVGKISLSKRGDGFVKIQTGSEIFVPARFTDTSITGDIVEVVPTALGKKDRLEGEVLKILKRGRQKYRLRISDSDKKNLYGKLLDVAGEEKEGFIKKASLQQDTLNAIKKGDVLVVKLFEEWAHHNNLYEVSFLRFESDSKEDSDLERILMKYDLDMNYPDYIKIDTDEEVNEKTVHDWKKRVDLRDIYTVTIDGKYSKDFDDAISLVEEGKKLRYYIHIADVSHYVKPDSALDEEAYERATSVYLGNRVVPMLPPLLSENLCSLVANKNRLAFTVEIEGNYDGKITGAKFYKSIIKVDTRYTYEMAEDEINADETGNWMCKVKRLSEGLRKSRIKAGRVDLNIKENHLVLDERHKIVEIRQRERLQSHLLIEEMMLTANIKVAEFIRKKKTPALFRIHEAMDEEKLETLNSFMKMYGFKGQLKDTSYTQIKKALAEVEGHPIEKIFNYILLRSFMQAYYSGEDLGHWGLGFKDYCHFTSPIRRFPDLVVHRVLDNLLKKEKPFYAKDVIDTMGLHCSEKERKAADSERDYYKLKVCRYIESTGKTEFSGNVTGIRPSQIFVEIDDPNLEGAILHTHLTNEGEISVRDDFSFYAKKYSTVVFLGQKVNVKLEKIDYEELRIYFKPVKFIK